MGELRQRWANSPEEQGAIPCISHSLVLLQPQCKTFTLMHI